MKAIEHTNNGKRFLLVEVPEGSHHVNINMHSLRIGKNGRVTPYRLPEGQWLIIGKADSLSEEQAERMHPERPWIYEPICRSNFINYKDAIQIVDARYRSLFSAKDSLFTLLEVHKLQPSTTIILQSK